MLIGETYAREVRFIEDGQVQTWDGRNVFFHSLIKRRWGWPKKAANAAAAVIVAHAKSMGTVPRIWVQEPERSQQQSILFSALPDLVQMLCAGLAGGSSREAEDCDHQIVGINVELSRAIDDDGLVNGITGSLAARFGCAPSDVREATRYHTGSPVVSMKVDVSKFTEDEHQRIR
jgi:hypothetical protein